jgi:hypothetical protein
MNSNCCVPGPGENTPGGLTSESRQVNSTPDTVKSSPWMHADSTAGIHNPRISFIYPLPSGVPGPSCCGTGIACMCHVDSMTMNADHISCSGPHRGMKNFILIVVILCYAGSSYMMAKGRHPRTIMDGDRSASGRFIIPGIADPQTFRIAKRHLPLTQRYQDWFVLSQVGYNHPDLAERSDVHCNPYGFLGYASAPSLDAGRAPPYLS